MSISKMAGALCPFLFMGCWNSPYAKGRAQFEKVVAAINADPISTLVLGGDNIYPEKIPNAAGGKDKKRYNIDKLVAGIASIKGKTMYAALGNHNIDDAAIEAYELNKKVAYMYAPYKMVLGSGSGSRAPWIMPDYNYVVSFADYNLVIIDTNAVDYPERFAILLSFLSGVIKTDRKPYFLVQHEPIISVRENKKEKGTAIPRALKEFKQILDILIVRPPVAILCADTHNFQHGLITYNGAEIHQYTVGTGGAEPDPFPSGYTVPVTPFVVEDVSYSLLEISSMYGYLRVIEGPAFEFVTVSPWSGGSRKTKKTRRRRSSRRR